MGDGSRIREYSAVTGPPGINRSPWGPKPRPAAERNGPAARPAGFGRFGELPTRESRGQMERWGRRRGTTAGPIMGGITRFGDGRRFYSGVGHLAGEDAGELRHRSTRGASARARWREFRRRDDQPPGRTAPPPPVSNSSGMSSTATGTPPARLPFQRKSNGPDPDKRVQDALQPGRARPDRRTRARPGPAGQPPRRPPPPGRPWPGPAPPPRRPRVRGRGRRHTA